MIVRALQLIGEKAIGASLSSSEQTAYLSALNAMMESWSIERLMCYHLTQDSKALTTSDGSYTIGSGGDWNTTRPTRIVDPCFIRDSNSNDTPLQIIGAESYGRIISKTSDGSYPQYIFYDAGFSSSLGTVYFWPEPAASLTAYINSWKQLTQFALISETVALPPGYQRAIEFNLAIELAGGFTKVGAEVVKIARESKAAIKGVNSPEVMMRLDAGIISRTERTNIFTGP
jgi:hypothetical protein